MPNWVRNIVTFSCSDERLNDIRKTLRNEEDDRDFDFGNLIPMPESLKIDDGTRTDRAEVCYNAKDEDEIRRLKEKYGGEFEELVKLGEICASNREKYGHRSWYDWSWENWGTKWNAGEPFWRDSSTLIFETAWSCPEPIFKKLAETFPDVGIHVKYADEDIGYNCGSLEYSGGKQTDVYFEPDGSYEFAFDVWDYDEEQRKEFLEDINLEIGE